MACCSSQEPERELASVEESVEGDSEARDAASEMGRACGGSSIDVSVVQRLYFTNGE